MATLTVDVTCLPNSYSNVGLSVQAWTSSSFIRNPSGQAPGPGAAVSTATTNSSGVASLTGLTSGTAYQVMVTDALGYFHWFPWASSLAIPGTLQANINMPSTKLLVPGGPIAKLPSASITNHGAAQFPLSSTSQVLSWGGATPSWQDAPFTWDSGNEGWDIGQNGIVQVSCKAFFAPNDNAAVDYPGYAIFAIYDGALNARLDYIQREFDTVAISGDDQSFAFTSLLAVNTSQILQIQVSTSFPTNGSGASWVLPKFDVVYLGPS